MQNICKLYDRLCKTISEFEHNYPNFTDSEAELRYLDTLAHAAKNVGKLIAMEMEAERETGGYANRGSYAGGSYAGRMSHRSFAGGSNGGASYRMSRMGYSRHGDVRDELIRLMSKTNDDREIQAIEAAIEQIERQ